MAKTKWVAIHDNQVRHVWTADCSDKDCENDGSTLNISPTFYEENGTPICAFCGEDYIYSHTEILEIKA